MFTVQSDLGHRLKSSFTKNELNSKNKMGGLFSVPKEDRYARARELWQQVHKVCQCMTESECSSYETECGLHLYDAERPRYPLCDPESLQAVSMIFEFYSKLMSDSFCLTMCN